MFKRLILLVMTVIIASAMTAAAIEESALEKEKTQEISLPIIMYHNITKKPSQLNRYTISPAELEDDFIYLKNMGYNTVTVQDVLEYVEHGKTLPEKPILLSFDDGNYGVYYYAYPLLKKYYYKAVVAVIGAVTDKYSETDAESVTSDSSACSLCPNMTWNQVNEMLQSGHAELQCHSYDLHKTARGAMGVQRYNGEPDNAYKSRIFNDLSRFQERAFEMSGVKTTAFIYPFGAISKGSRQVIQDFGFKASFSCTEGINKISQGDASIMYDMKRLIRPHGVSIANILG